MFLTIVTAVSLSVHDVELACCCGGLLCEEEMSFGASALVCPLMAPAERAIDTRATIPKTTKTTADRSLRIGDLESELDTSSVGLSLFVRSCSGKLDFVSSDSDSK